MQLPQPEVTEHHPDDLPTEFRFASAFAPLMASWGELEPRRAEPDRASVAQQSVPVAPGLERTMLERFQRLMAADGWPVQIGRMCCDRLYARERIALGHTSPSWNLRQLSLQLFRYYDEPSALH
jgi:hypothetical protein